MLFPPSNFWKVVASEAGCHPTHASYIAKAKSGGGARLLKRSNQFLQMKRWKTPASGMGRPKETLRGWKYPKVITLELFNADAVAKYQETNV